MSMGSYSLFAWRDAMELARLLEQTFQPRDAYQFYEELSQDQLRALESELRSDIYDLIAATESKRPSLLRRIEKKASEKKSLLALLFAIMAQVRTKDEIFRLRPGGSNRGTCAQCYALEEGRRHSKVVYEFPFEVFDAYCSSADFWGNDDD